MLRLAEIKGFELAYRSGKMTAKQLVAIGKYGMDNIARSYYNAIMEDILWNKL